MTSAAGVNPLLAGALCRCPNCGQGPLFQGFLTLVPFCARCGYDLGHTDSGDGPAVFVIIIVGFIAVFGALFMEVAVNPPIWVCSRSGCRWRSCSVLDCCGRSRA